MESGCLSWNPAIYGEDEQRYCKGALCNQHVPRDQSRVIAKENKAREENYRTEETGMLFIELLIT